MGEADDSRLTAARVAELLSAAGVSVPPGAPEKLVLHAREMLRWNRAIRLTAITAPDEVAVKHVVDSLLLLRFSPFGGRTLDFGSGPGYPGIPLAVCLPESRVVLLESSAKKCAFLSHACALLGLPNAEVVQGRLSPREPRPIGRFEQIVTRATLPPSEAARLLVPYVSPGGRLLLLTGPGSAGRAEASVAAGAVASRQVEFTLPLSMGSRVIVEVTVP